MVQGRYGAGEGQVKGGAGASLYETEEVQLFHRPAGSDHSVVLFGEPQPGARIHGAWLSGPRHAGVDLYEIVPRRRGHYPAHQIETIARLIAETRSRPAIALGAGLGGLAALRHGRHAGCAVALAFSPLGVAPSGDPAAGPDLLQEELGDTALVAFDPELAGDSIQAEALRLLEGVRAVPLPFMGHRTERVLIGEGVAHRVFGAALRGETGEVARLLRQGRAQDDGFLSRLSLACSRHGHYRWAADIADKGDPARRHLPDLAMARAEALAGLGRPLKAVETLEGLVVAAPQSPRYWMLLVDRYEAMGQDRAAAEVLELALSVTENFGFCSRLIRKLAGMGGAALEQAILLAEMAQEQWPDRRGQIANLVRAVTLPA